MKRLTALWVRKAERDYLAAAELAASKHDLHDQIAFLAQQAVEKYLKALLQHGGLPIHRTHDLTALLKQLRPHHRDLGSLRRGAEFLTRFAVETRYPGYNVTRRQAASSLRWAQRCRDMARGILGLG